MDKELFKDLVESLKEAVAISRGEIQPASEFIVERVDVKKVREATGQSQRDFARLIWISPRTLQNWEQGRTQPTGPAIALLRAISHSPEAVIKALNDRSWIKQVDTSAPAKPSALQPSSHSARTSI